MKYKQMTYTQLRDSIVKKISNVRKTGKQLVSNVVNSPPTYV